VSIDARQNLTLAGDLELTRASTPRGEWRDAALGVESHPAVKAWLRGGIHWNTAGGPGTGAAPVGSVGASYTVYGSVLADGQVSFGSADGDRGWGIGLRYVF
jgi:hypothetical protein